MFNSWNTLNFIIDNKQQQYSVEKDIKILLLCVTGLLILANVYEIWTSFSLSSLETLNLSHAYYFGGSKVMSVAADIVMIPKTIVTWNNSLLGCGRKFIVLFYSPATFATY